MKLDAHVHTIFSSKINDIGKPAVEFEVEVGSGRIAMGSRVNLPGPTRAKLIIMIRNGSGWVVDVLRNGLVEEVHSSRHIEHEDFCVTIDVGVHTSCAFRISCRREYDVTLSDPIVLRLESGVAAG